MRLYGIEVTKHYQKIEHLKTIFLEAYFKHRTNRRKIAEIAKGHLIRPRNMHKISLHAILSPPKILYPPFSLITRKQPKGNMGMKNKQNT